MLTDQFWVRESRLGNMVLGYQKMADNGDFVIGALDNLSGSSDLISIRARGKFQRPFDKVDQIRKGAEQKFLAKQQELEGQRTKLEGEIGEIMKQAPSGQGLMFTPEMDAKLKELRAAAVKTRKELREVKYQSEREERALATRLKVLNLGLMPLAVGVLAIGLSIYRVNRRRTVRTAASKGLS